MGQNYYTKFIEFLINHNIYDQKTFEYIWEQCSFFDYRDDEKHPYIGIYYVFSRHDKLLGFDLIVPFVDNEESLLINIHEFVHAIEAYNYLGKNFKVDTLCEVNSLLFEKLYLKENKNDKLIEFSNKLNKDRIDNGDAKYIIGLKVADELLKEYSNNFSLDKLAKKSKRLIKKINI